MGAVLDRILDTGMADGESVPLGHSYMDAEEGALIDRIFRAVRPDISIEVGLSYGVSALFACEALAANGKNATHIVLDPGQNAPNGCAGLGLRNIERAGYAHLVDFREKRSEIELPALHAQGTRIQAAIIDGWHTFDHALVDFFYINKMLDVDGIVIIDDTNFAAISRLARHIMTYPAYEVFATTAKPRADRMRTRIRRALAARIPTLYRDWDFPTCMAFRKIAEDQRDWDWHVNF